MSHDSNHNVGKGPFVYKQTYLANLLGCLKLWLIWLFLSYNICCLQMFNFDRHARRWSGSVWPKSFMVNISLDGHFLAVTVTPNPCPRHVCLMSVTKEIHVNCWRTQLWCIKCSLWVKISTMKGFIWICCRQSALFSVGSYLGQPIPITCMAFHVHVGKSVLLMRSCFWTYRTISRQKV